MYTLEATARSHRRIWDAALASSWFHWGERDQQNWARMQQTIAGGPGRAVSWIETLSPQQRIGLAEAEREAEETRARLRAMGAPVDASPADAAILGRMER